MGLAYDLQNSLWQAKCGLGVVARTSHRSRRSYHVAHEAVNGRIFLPRSFHVLADLRGVTHLEDAIVMLLFF
jgi:hypothetical protein